MSAPGRTTCGEAPLLFAVAKGWEPPDSAVDPALPRELALRTEPGAGGGGRKGLLDEVGSEARDAVHMQQGGG